MLGLFRPHGCWQEDEGKAERLAQPLWCDPGRESRQLDTFARRLGNGQVRFPGGRRLCKRCPGERGEQTRNVP
jgi:hypothetical protein